MEEFINKLQNHRIEEIYEKFENKVFKFDFKITLLVINLPFE